MVGKIVAKNEYVIFLLTKCSFQNLPVVCTAFNLIVIRTAQHRVDMDIERAQKAEVSEMYFGPATQGVLNQTSRERERDFSSNQSTLSAGSLQ